MRRARLAEKAPKRIRPSRSRDSSRWVVMRKPEMTKKTSTPTYPPERVPTPEWKSTTSSTAIARKPWMSGRKPDRRGAVGLGAGAAVSVTGLLAWTAPARITKRSRRRCCPVTYAAPCGRPCRSALRGAARLGVLAALLDVRGEDLRAQRLDALLQRLAVLPG